jgi:hypothetical protein
MKMYLFRIYMFNDEVINVVIYNLNANIHIYEVLNEIYLSSVNFKNIFFILGFIFVKYVKFNWAQFPRLHN